MTLGELEYTLPNGLHDAEVQRRDDLAERWRDQLPNAEGAKG
jgi:hypothetical protein